MEKTMQHSLGELVQILPPGLNNPRNSEGSFLQMKNGELIYVYSCYSGTDFQDNASCNLAILCSKDKGRSFSEPSCFLFHQDEKGINIMSVSLLEMQNGDIGLFYLVKETEKLVRVWLRRSSDFGKTWSERVLCTAPAGIYILNNDRVLRLQNGDILLPVAFHRYGYNMQPGELGDGRMDPDGQMMTFISKDDGYTWQYTNHKCSLPYSAHCKSGLQEPGLLELYPGVLWAWARTELGRQYESFSMDGGISWSAAQPSRFTSPNSPLSMKRLPDGRIFAVWNPIPNYNGRKERKAWTGGRNPLVCAVSKDNGRSFYGPMVLEEDENSGFCYCSIYATDDHALLLGYCAGNQEDGSCLARTHIRRIELDELDRRLKELPQTSVF